MLQGTHMRTAADDCGEQKGKSLCAATTSNCTLCKRASRSLEAGNATRGT